MKTAVTYARFSSARQHETSIEAQRDAMAKWCAQRSIRIVQEYADRAASGTKTEGRDDFLQMLADLKQRRVDYVLVHKYDRFARNENDQYFYMAMIEQRGAKLVAVAQEFGDGPEARFMLGVITAYNAFYSANLSAESKKGKNIIKQHGKHTGGPYPIGYDPDGKGNYVVNEVEAYFVRELYNAVITHRRLDDVVAEMREAGLRGRYGGVLKTANLARIVRNPVYMGVYQRTLSDGTLVRLENHHAAIVDQKTYEEANRIMDARANAGRNDRKIYPLSGIAYCACCGAKLLAQTTRKDANHEYTSYYCSKCHDLRRIPAKELDGAAVDYLNALFAPERRAELAKAVEDYSKRLISSAVSRQPSASREIKKLQREIDSLAANLAAGVLSPDMLTMIDQQITTRRERIKILQETSATPAPVTAADIDSFFADAATLSLGMDPRYLRQVMRKYIKRVTVHTTEIEIVSTFDDWIGEKLRSDRESSDDGGADRQSIRIASNPCMFDVILTLSLVHRVPLPERYRPFHKELYNLHRNKIRRRKK